MAHSPQSTKCLPEDLLMRDKLIARGSEYIMRGIFSEAIMCFQRVLRLNPEDFFALAGLATTLSMSENYSLASDIFRRAIAISSNDRTVMHNFAITLTRAGNVGEARAVLQEIVKNHEDFMELNRISVQSTTPSKDEIAMQNSEIPETSIDRILESLSPQSIANIKKTDVHVVGYNPWDDMEDEQNSPDSEDNQMKLKSEFRPQLNSATTPPSQRKQSKSPKQIRPQPKQIQTTKVSQPRHRQQSSPVRTPKTKSEIELNSGNPLQQKTSQFPQKRIQGQEQDLQLNEKENQQHQTQTSESLSQLPDEILEYLDKIVPISKKKVPDSMPTSVSHAELNVSPLRKKGMGKRRHSSYTQHRPSEFLELNPSPKISGNPLPFPKLSASKEKKSTVRKLRSKSWNAGDNPSKFQNRDQKPANFNPNSIKELKRISTTLDPKILREKGQSINLDLAKISTKYARDNSARDNSDAERTPTSHRQSHEHKSPRRHIHSSSSGKRTPRNSSRDHQKYHSRDNERSPRSHEHRRGSQTSRDHKRSSKKHKSPSHHKRDQQHTTPERNQTPRAENKSPTDPLAKNGEHEKILKSPIPFPSFSPSRVKPKQNSEKPGATLIPLPKFGESPRKRVKKWK